MLPGGNRDWPAGALRWRGHLVCALDGTTMSVPDSPANLAPYRHQSGSHGGSGYPLVRLPAGVVCGTRTVLAATFGPFTTGETRYAPALFGCLRAGMVLPANRNLAVKALVTAIASAARDLLIRCKNSRLATLPDGSWTSMLGGRDPGRPHHRHPLRRQPANRPLPADHHPARPAPLPRP
ncbi:hypothetical protein [Nonomuraea insulae]|uniref:DDE superfamily endonuclease n=1 Tax=Nonomuraea insulae TaxID=1616787 RepID=A0ABW1D7Y9_9ACTN